MSVTSTETVIAAPAKSSLNFLRSSIDFLSPPRQRNSHVSSIYKEASTLFLTRRLAEAYATLQEILIPPEDNAEDSTLDTQAKDDNEPERTAPIATASRSQRVKVWSLYLTLLNAIIELGPTEGKAAVGAKHWRDIAAKSRDGSIWDEVVRIGYGGIEGNVDADVVTNLATLLLTHSPSQTTNQQHLETYLATSDLPSEVKQSDPFDSSHRMSANSTITLRDLSSRLKILELYILHVLPANEEWDYASEFISLNATLDDERKELFQQALSELKTAQTKAENPDAHDHDLYHLEEAEPMPVDDSSHQQEQQHPPEYHRRSNSEHDYGIEDAQKTTPRAKDTNIQSSSRTNKSNHRNPKSLQPTKSSPRKPINNKGILTRSAALITFFQNLISNMTHSLSRNPVAVLRFVLFLAALLVALSRRDVKDRIRKVMGKGWEKVMGTVGMGVKVSYI
ncbi:MAG: hypothetical protein Q9222_005315 [Ikaeria aurantiellina]